MKIVEKNNNIIVSEIECLDLALTLDCGQAFRWSQDENGQWCGVAGGHYLTITKDDDGNIVFHNTSLDVFNGFWVHYFDLERDYVEICNRLKGDKLVAKAIDDYYGIRILNQEPWEALCSFVISQQNNIKRIKSLVDKICTAYGKEIMPNIFAFPSAEELSRASEEDLRSLGLGYRAEYLVKLANGVKNGEIDLEKIKAMPTEDARQELKKIRGVGTKVANCAMLFGMEFYDCVPVDTWINKALKYYPDGLPKCFDGIEGIAQQYLFHWARNNL